MSTDAIANDMDDTEVKARITAAREQLQDKVKGLAVESSSKEVKLLDQRAILENMITSSEVDRMDARKEERAIEPEEENFSSLNGLEEKEVDSKAGSMELVDLSLPDLKAKQDKYMDHLKELRRVVKAKVEVKDPEVQREYNKLQEKLLGMDSIIKDKENRQAEILKGTKSFNKVYGKIKKTVFSLYYTYKGEVLEDIEGDIEDLAALREQLNCTYEECRALAPPDNEIRRKVDGGIQMCTDLIEALERIRGNPFMTTKTRKELLKAMCGRDYSRSVFGSNLDKVSEVSQQSKSLYIQDAESVQSGKSLRERKLAVLEAQRKRTDLNAKVLQHQAALSSIEEQLKIVDLEEKLKIEESDCGSIPGNLQPIFQSHADPQFSAPKEKLSQSSVPHERGDSDGQTGSQLAIIAQTFSDSINKSRLPVPTPPVFDGDPLKYVNFKKSFVALVENRGVPASDKLYYLQQYLTGEAKSAVEGCFFGSDETAYRSAWERLEKRFGHPFTIQQSLRNKLKEWPRVPPDDGRALQDFCDFLRTLQEAMLYVAGLRVLDDYVQIQEISAKLPNWCRNRWTRIVTTNMNEGQGYPSFATFVNFVDTEAQVATNPMCTSQVKKQPAQGKPSSQHVAKRTLGIAHASHMKEGPGRKQDGSKDRPPCALCANPQHTIGRCGQFKQLPLDEKLKCIKEKNLCFKCLRHGHPSRRCPNKIVCYTCQGNHHTLLHLDKPVGADKKSPNSVVMKGDNKLTNADPVETQEPSSVESISNKTQSDKTQRYTSMVLPVWVKTEQDGSQEVLTYALVDTQSDNHYITEDLAEKLNMPHEETRMKLKTMTSVSVLNCRKYYNVKLRGYDMNAEVVLKSCYTQAHIPYSRDQIPSKVAVSKSPHLAHIAPLIPPEQDCEVGLLIGYTCPQAFRPLEVVSGPPEEAFATKTDLGWSVIGGSSYGEETGNICHRVASKELIAPSPCDVLKVLDQDFKDTKDDVTCSNEDLVFLRTMEQGIKINDKGRISMPLPLRSNAVLPNNRHMALSRLNSLKRKLTKNETFHIHYREFMQQMIDKGFAEEVRPPSEGEVVNYIPHQGVYHPHKPNKIRVVFDGSAKYKGVSLNDMLLKGPDLMNGLIGVLLRFRQDKIALTCDIEQMFYNFEVHEEHRNMLRFLWWPGGDVSRTPAEYRLTVHLFGAASSPGCANYGLKYLARCHEETFPQGATFLKKNLYMDDGLCSLSTKEEAMDLVRQATEICRKGNIRLHKFLSNSKEVLESIHPSERAAAVAEIDLEMESLPIERTLGVKWDIQQDCFIFKVALKDKPNTRRGILSSVMSVYDPNGFVSPVILEGKKILQSLCQQKKSWDEPVEGEVSERWEKWKKNLYELEMIKIPRCIRPDCEVEKYELHHFSDASMQGYGQCSYVRMCCKDESISCALLMSKARVAPSKVVSIPRLELTAATMSVKISKLLRREMEIPISEEYFWTDSKVVLGYIANDAKRFHVFVSNRVQYIRDNTETRQWHYVPTKSNPADLASRGTSAKELCNSVWLQGPSILLEKKLPLEKPESTLSTGDPEVKAQCMATTTQIDLLDRLDRLSKWQSMLNALSVLIRRVCGQQSRLDIQKKAAKLILNCLQRKEFPEEVAALEKGRKIASTSPLKGLDPMLDEAGLMRVGGRIQSSQNLSEDERHPVILPRKAHVTQAIIRHIHEKTNHGGRSFTLNELRTQGFYVLRGSKVVAQVIRSCVMCRRQRGPTESQKMSDLPSERTEMQPVFYSSGMDVFGPYIIKRGRSEVKRYGLLFTCLYSRAIHIELLDDLSTDCFLNALRCFLALRGVVKTIFCDQGTNFVGGNNELKNAMTELDHNKLEVSLSKKQVEFKFNVPHASEQGGVWERQIRTVRNVLKSVIDFANTRLDDSSLRTLFYEATYIVNNRPLSPVSLNDPLAEPPITPNALLHGRLEAVLPPPATFCAQDVYARKRWRRVQHLCELFWNKWKKEYLLHLQQRQKWYQSRRNLEKGDIVLMVEETLPRSQWPLGIVTNAIKDKDGLVRKVDIRISNARSVERGVKTKKISDLQRPVQKVILLCPKLTSNDL